MIVPKESDAKRAEAIHGSDDTNERPFAIHLYQLDLGVFDEQS